jgi:hypothetical protein
MAVSAPQVALDDIEGIQADLTSIKTVHDSAASGEAGVEGPDAKGAA